MELAELVLDRIGRPIDAWAVAATLESQGLRDVDARERYGRRDIFDLADAVYAECIARAVPDAAEGSPPPSRLTGLGRSARFFFQGGFFFVSLGVQFASLIVLGYGMWASLDFSIRQASIVGVALLFAFAVTGATAQALGYLGPYTQGPGRHAVARRVTSLVIATGFGAAVVVGAIALAANAMFGWYDTRTIGAGLAYYFLVAALSLASAVLYMLKQYAALVGSTLAGLAVTGLVLDHTSFGIYGAHWSGLAAATFLQATWAFVVLQRRVARMPPELALAKVPRLGVLVSLATPFLLYGTGYFLLLFVDRFAAWSADSPGRPFTFLPGYEVGLDWALITVAPALAYLEVVVHAFSERLEQLGGRVATRDVSTYRRDLRRFFARRFAIVVLLLAFGALVGAAALRAGRHGGPHVLRRFAGDPLTVRVYVIGFLGYAFLTCALLSATFLFSLSRPWFVLRALAPALAIGATLSFVLANIFSPWTAVCGMAAATFVFAALAARATLETLRRADYHYFAAY